MRAILLIVAMITAAAAYLLGTPYTLIAFGEFWAGFRTQMRLGGEAWEGQVVSPSGMLYVQALGHGVGWIMLGLAIVGLVLLVRRDWRATVILAAFPVCFLLFMLRTELFFVRFALPLVPFVCLLAAGGTILLAKRVGGPGDDRRPAAGSGGGGWAGQPFIGGPYAARGEGAQDAQGAQDVRGSRNSRSAALAGVLIALVALLEPTMDVVRHDRLVTQEDTRVLAARWALANIPPDQKVAIEEYTIRDRRPRAYGGPSWQLDTDLFNVNDVRASDPSAPLRGSARYFITSSFQYERFGGGARATPQRAFYEALAREGRLLAEFNPGIGNTPLPFDLEDLYTPFWNLDRYERPGPTIRVYELRQS